MDGATAASDFDTSSHLYGAWVELWATFLFPLSPMLSTSFWASVTSPVNYGLSLMPYMGRAKYYSKQSPNSLATVSNQLYNNKRYIPTTYPVVVVNLL